MLLVMILQAGHNELTGIFARHVETESAKSNLDIRLKFFVPLPLFAGYPHS